MTTDEQLLENVKRATAELAAASTRRDDAIVKAAEKHSIRAIAAAAGTLSPARIGQIVQKAKS